MKKYREKNQQYVDEYYEVVQPEILREHPRCQCGVVCGGNSASQHAHHRRGRKGKQDGIPLIIYKPLLLAVCHDCHRHIHDNPGQAYDEKWMYRKNALLPPNWMLDDPFIKEDVA